MDQTEPTAEHSRGRQPVRHIFSVIKINVRRKRISCVRRTRELSEKNVCGIELECSYVAISLEAPPVTRTASEIQIPESICKAKALAKSRARGQQAVVPRRIHSQKY